MTGGLFGTENPVNLIEGVFGNDAICADISSRIARGDLSHAYIVEGDPGSGRHTLALATAAALAPQSLRDKVMRGLCPDIMYIGIDEGRKTTGVDTVREIRRQAMMTPTELDFKFFIIENAETLTPGAQNAFLKMLEEPPAGNYFFLLIRSGVLLLPTVLSRCVHIRMQRFSDEELADYLVGSEKSARELRESDSGAFDRLVHSADGCPGAALALLKKKKGKKSEKTSTPAEAAEEFVGALSELSSNSSTASLIVFLAGRVPKDREEFSSLLDYTALALRDLLRVKYRALSYGEPCEGNELCFYTTPEKAENAASVFAVSSLDAYCRAIVCTRDELPLNVNITNAAAMLLIRLLHAADVFPKESE